MRCDWNTTDDETIVVCKRCKREQRTKSGTKIRRQCTWEPRFPLGTWLARFLRLFGITPKRVERITGKPCGCKQRQQKMNELLG